MEKAGNNVSNSRYLQIDHVDIQTHFASSINNRFFNTTARSNGHFYEVAIYISSS